MDMKIGESEQLLPAQQLPKAAEKDKAGQEFGKILKDTVNEVNELQMKADQAVKELAGGEKKDIHSTMIALQKADVSFKLLMQVRNKVVAAYKEVMSMQI